MQKPVEINIFRSGMAHFMCKSQTERGVVHRPLLVSETTVIALSCTIKISAVHCLVLSQSTCVTDRRTNSKNYDS